jgi:hypothetical protein
LGSWRRREGSRIDQQGAGLEGSEVGERALVEHLIGRPDHAGEWLHPQQIAYQPGPSADGLGLQVGQPGPGQGYEISVGIGQRQHAASLDGGAQPIKPTAGILGTSAVGDPAGI